MTARIDKLLDKIGTRALIAVLVSIAATTFLVSYLYLYKHQLPSSINSENSL